jgi:hypothetical protein
MEMGNIMTLGIMGKGFRGRFGKGKDGLIIDVGLSN